MSQVEQVSGGFGNDNLTGTTGPNVLSGSAGHDTIDGLAGTDNLIGGVGADDVIGGAGTDSTTYGPGFANNEHFAAVTVTLDGVTNDGSSEDDNGSRRDNIGADVENVIGGNGNDSLAAKLAEQRPDRRPRGRQPLRPRRQRHVDGP